MSRVANSSQLAPLLTQPLDNAFTNRGKKLKKIFPQFLQVKDPGQRGQWIDFNMAKFGPAVKKGSENPLTYDELVMGQSFTATFDSYALAWRIAREVSSDLAGGGYGSVEKAFIAGLADATASFQDSCLATQEDLAAQLILLANSATATSKWIGAGRDGVALAGTHTLLKSGAGTFSNVMTGANLSYYQLISALTLMASIPSDEGFYSSMPSEVDLVVGLYNMPRAYELLNTEGGKKPDSNESNKSALNQFKINVIVDSWLGPTFKGWAVMDSDRHKCYFFDREKPMLEEEGDFEVKGFKKSVFMRCSVSFSSPFGFVFNPGP